MKKLVFGKIIPIIYLVSTTILFVMMMVYDINNEHYSTLFEYVSYTVLAWFVMSPMFAYLFHVIGVDDDAK